jgi:hypothetical protein
MKPTSELQGYRRSQFRMLGVPEKILCQQVAPPKGRMTDWSSSVHSQLVWFDP